MEAATLASLGEWDFRPLLELLELRTLKTPEQCRRVAACLEARVAQVDQKIRELQAFREGLANSLKRCERAISREECCPVVVDLANLGGSH